MPVIASQDKEGYYKGTLVYENHDDYLVNLGGEEFSILKADVNDVTIN